MYQPDNLEIIEVRKKKCGFTPNITKKIMWHISFWRTHCFGSIPWSFELRFQNLVARDYSEEAYDNGSIKVLPMRYLNSISPENLVLLM